MSYKIFLIIVFLLTPAAVRADPEESRYRVEILVLTHLEHDQAPDEVPVLADFSDALDFLTPPPAEEEQPESARSVAEVPPAEPPADPETGTEEAEETEPACSVVQVTEMGPEMQEAWRRLRLSGPFRPLQYLAWEQPGEAPFPELRIHDLETVLTEDPWQNLREPVVEDQEDAPWVFGDTVDETPAVEREEGGDSEDAEDAEMGPLPSPIAHYRLDGKAQLVRTRFLHLAVAVEWREPVFDPLAEPLQVVPADSAGAEPGPYDEPRPTAFRVQRLDQRRQVKTGRMEYFDGPVLGVLAFVTDISDTLAEATVEE